MSFYTAEDRARDEALRALRDQGGNNTGSAGGAGSDGTYHLNYCDPNSPSFSIMPEPFMPKVRVTGESDAGDYMYEVEFNQGYVFDYADGGRKISVTGVRQSLDQGDAEFQIRLDIDDQNGKIKSAGIVKDGETNFTNLVAVSYLEEYSSISDATISLDLADFSKGRLDNIYIRENIHMYMRGHRQLGANDDDMGGAGSGAKAVMKTDGSSLDNGFIDYRGLIPDPKTGNQIEIGYSGDNITFYVPPPSGSDEN